MSYLYYLVLFNKKLVQALINLDNKLNIISLTFAKKLGLWVWRTKVGIKKIDSSSLKIFEIVISSLLIDNKAGGLWFFKKNFLIANISINIAFGMFFYLEQCKNQFLETKTLLEFLYYYWGSPNYQPSWIVREKKVCNSHSWSKNWDLYSICSFSYHQ